MPSAILKGGTAPVARHLLTLLTTEKILELSSGEVTSPGTISPHSSSPLPSGIFCQRIFGPVLDYQCFCGLKKGLKHKGSSCPKCYVPCLSSDVRSQRMGHLRLPKPIVHPLFYKAVARHLGIGIREVARIAKGLDSEHSLDWLLARCRANKEASSYLLTHLLIMPPGLRLPESRRGLPGSGYVNHIYQDIIKTKIRLEKVLEDGTQTFRATKELALLQTLVHQLFLGGYVDMFGNRTTGIVGMLSGKEGLVRQSLLGKRVDFSGRAGIVCNPKLKLDEVGIPESIAFAILEPFIVSQLVRDGHSQARASELVTDRAVKAYRALVRIVPTRQVLLNRQPTMHQYNLMAFTPVLVSGSAIHIPPLLCGPFDADFDGDTMSIYAVLSQQANLEVSKLRPAALTTNVLTGKPLFLPSHEMLLGLRLASQCPKGRQDLVHIFGDAPTGALTKSKLERLCTGMTTDSIQDLQDLGLRWATTSGQSISYADMKKGDLQKEWADAGIRVRPSQLEHLRAVTNGQTQHEFWRNAEIMTKVRSGKNQQVGILGFLLRILMSICWDIKIIEEDCGAKYPGIVVCESAVGVCQNCYDTHLPLDTAVGLQAAAAVTYPLYGYVMQALHNPGRIVNIAKFRQLFELTGDSKSIKLLYNQKQDVTEAWLLFRAEALYLYRKHQLEVDERHLAVCFRALLSFSRENGRLVPRHSTEVAPVLTGARGLYRKYPSWAKALSFGWVGEALASSVDSKESDLGLHSERIIFGKY